MVASVAVWLPLAALSSPCWRLGGRENEEVFALNTLGQHVRADEKPPDLLLVHSAVL